MAFTLTVHEYQRVPGSLEVRLVRTNPYLALTKKVGDSAEMLFIQSGQVWSAGGVPIENLPDWFAEELAKCSPAALLEAGWKPVPPAPARETLSVKKAS